MTEEKNAHSVPPPKFTISPEFPQWLLDHKISLAFTARRVNKVFLAGVNPEGGLSLFERTFQNASGLAVAGDSLFLSTLYQIWHLKNSLPGDQEQNGYDRVYLPRTAHVTGDCAVHEMGIAGGRQLVLVNTRFSCLAALSPSHSFKPVWKPPFITGLTPEDKCHLNGMALDEKGGIQYVTACALSDEKEGWKKNREDGGCLMAVQTGRVVLEGLSMPHSPRIHDGKVWLLNSGHGQVGYFDPKTNSFVPVVTCPGFLRGLCFVDRYALVTVSRPRAAKVFSGLPLERVMKENKFESQCGLLVIDLEKRKIVHGIGIDGVIEELMDVVVLPGCKRPMLMGLRPDEIKGVFSIEPGAPPRKPDKAKNPILV